MARSITEEQNKPAQHLEGVISGKWGEFRQIWSPSQSVDAYEPLLCGNFDHDPDSELLLPKSNLLLELEGSRRQTALPAMRGFIDTLDFDGDGIDDVLDCDFALTHSKLPYARQAGLKDRMEVHDLSGKSLGFLPGHPMGPQIVHGDFDGDGRIDLFMSQEGDYGRDPSKQAQAFGWKGQLIFSAGNEWNTPYLLAGDLDGDGKDEILGRQRGGWFSLTGAGARQLGGTNFADSPNYCCDLDGDGRDELIGSDGSVTNPSGGGFKLERLGARPGLTLNGMFGGLIKVFSDKGQMRLVALDGDIFTAETVLIWDGQGKLLYAADLGCKAYALEIARAGGQDHICILSQRGMQVWP